MGKFISDKKSVRLLVDQFIAQGVVDVVISPGSRNAPLIISFTALDCFNCISIVDERSAGFIALGMAQQSGKTVALVCTSGTAALNYAPAVAEAYYQGVSLVVVTADRPSEWIDQADGQTIRQHGIYGNYIKYSCSLPVDIYTSDDEWHVKKMISEAFIKSCKSTPGPVHINVPLREPLYGCAEFVPSTSSAVKMYQSSQGLSVSVIEQLAMALNGYQRVMILVGMHRPDAALQRVLSDLEQNDRFVVLTESLSNCHNDGFIDCIDRVVSSIKTSEVELFKPDLLITFDGPVLSKMVKTFLRQNPPIEHWHVSKAGEFIDTYQQLSRIIECCPAAFLTQLLPLINAEPNEFAKRWKSKSIKASHVHDDFLKTIPYSDLKVFETIFNYLPQPSVLQLSNSTPVRYAQFFNQDKQIENYSNRGTSGIDGSTSTAVGAALVRNGLPVVLITGDLSFFYDSNALWNHYLPDNLKIILVNNGGGGIFRFLPGSSDSDVLESFFATGHTMNAEHTAKQFKVNYQNCHSVDELTTLLPLFFAQKKVSILEIKTPVENNATVLKSYFKAMAES